MGGKLSVEDEAICRVGTDAAGSDVDGAMVGGWVPQAVILKEIRTIKKKGII